MIPLAWLTRYLLLVECRTLWCEPEWVHVQNMEKLPLSECDWAYLRLQYKKQKCTDICTTKQLCQVSLSSRHGIPTLNGCCTGLAHHVLCRTYASISPLCMVAACRRSSTPCALQDVSLSTLRRHFRCLLYSPLVWLCQTNSLMDMARGSRGGFRISCKGGPEFCARAKFGFLINYS